MQISLSSSSSTEEFSIVALQHSIKRAKWSTVRSSSVVSEVSSVYFLVTIILDSNTLFKVSTFCLTVSTKDCSHLIKESKVMKNGVKELGYQTEHSPMFDAMLIKELITMKRPETALFLSWSKQ